MFSLVLLFAALTTLVVAFGADKISVNIEHNHLSELEQCQSNLAQSEQQYTQLHDLKKSVCECPTNKFSLVTGLWSFFCGAAACAFTIFYGYPLVEKKLNKNRKESESKSKQSK